MQVIIVAQDGFVEGNTARSAWIVLRFEVSSRRGGRPGGGEDAARQLLHRIQLERRDLFASAMNRVLETRGFVTGPAITYLTQEVVHKTIGDLFTATPDGLLPGNDDLGATSPRLGSSSPCLASILRFQALEELRWNSRSPFDEANLKLGDR